MAHRPPNLEPKWPQVLLTCSQDGPRAPNLESRWPQNRPSWSCTGKFFHSNHLQTYMYICVYTYICFYTYICIHMYTYIYICVCLSISLSMYTDTYVCISVRVCFLDSFFKQYVAPRGPPCTAAGSIRAGAGGCPIERLRALGAGMLPTPPSPSPLKSWAWRKPGNESSPTLHAAPGEGSQCRIHEGYKRGCVGANHL